jgi:hypothetical protein
MVISRAIIREYSLKSLAINGSWKLFESLKVRKGETVEVAFSSSVVRNFNQFLADAVRFHVTIEF